MKNGKQRSANRDSEMAKTGEALTVWAHDHEGRSAVPQSRSIRMLETPDITKVRTPNVFVLTSAIHLPEVTGFVRSLNKQHWLRVLFIRADVDARLLPQMLERADLRVLKNTLVHSGSELPKRVLQAWHCGAQDHLIATAEVVEDRLLVISCALEMFEIPFDSLPALRSMPAHLRSAFDISSEGSYLHWPEPDIHLDMEAFRYAADPRFRERAEAIKLAADTRFGRAIARIRKQKGLTQADIRGLSDRHVRRIEKGAQPRISSLTLLAEGHGLSLNEYLNLIAESMNAEPFLRNGQSVADAPVS